MTSTEKNTEGATEVAPPNAEQSSESAPTFQNVTHLEVPVKGEVEKSSLPSVAASGRPVYPKPAWIETPEGRASFERWCENRTKARMPSSAPRACEPKANDAGSQITMGANAFDKVGSPTLAETIIERIASDEFSDAINAIRQKYSEVLAAIGDLDKAKKAIAPLKEQLPVATFSGQFSDLRAPVAEKLIQHSGLFCADLDKLGDRLNDVRVALLESEHLWSIFLSPSGDGLKAIFRLPQATALQHKRCLFPAVRDHVLALTGEEIDNCSDVGRLCFLSYDPDASLNDKAIALPVDLTIEDQPKAEKRKGLKPSKETVRSMLAALPIGEGRTRPGYEEWLRVIAAVQDALPESDAIAVLKEWSLEERTGEYEDKLASNLNKISVATLYYMALENGWKMPYEPPPLDLLPDYLQEHVCREAGAANVDVSFILLPLLSSLGAAIGSLRTVMLKEGWTEPPILWTGIIASSGQGKSPALKAATLLQREYEKGLSDWNESAEIDFKQKLQEAKVKKGEPPEQPIFKTCLMSDLTLEVLAVRLKDNPRGVLVEKDELAGWFASFDQYHDGKGADVAKWLSLWSGSRIAVDRKGSRPIRISDPRVCLTGGIQPEILKKALTFDFFARGLPARFIFAAPPPRKRLWTQKGASASARQEAIEQVMQLFALQPDPDGEDALTLTPGAQQTFIDFVNECAEECAATSSERNKAFVSKLAATAARLALIGQLARDHNSSKVVEHVMEAACDLARWAGRETQRIYAVNTETKEQRETRELVEFIRKKGGTVSVRDLQNGPRRYRSNKESAEEALEALVKQGLVERFEDKPERGRPVLKYRLGTL